MAMAAAGETLINYGIEKKQARLDEAKYQQNRINAAAARDLEISVLNRRMIQEGEAASAQKEQLAIAALQKTETSKVAAGETGFKGGSSIDNAVSKFETARLKGTDVINTQTEALRQEIELQKLGSNSKAINRIDSMPRGQEPSFLAAVVKAGSQLYAGKLEADAADPMNIAKKDLAVKDATGQLMAQRATTLYGPRVSTPTQIPTLGYKVGFGLQNFGQ